MSSSFLAFSSHLALFENNTDTIIDQWVKDDDLLEVLYKHEIEAHYFAENFAVHVLDYFLAVAKGTSAIGDCPVMGKFLQFLRDKDINSSELFVICTKFRQAMIHFCYKKSIDSEALYDDIAYMFDQNFAGVLKLFSKTIKQAETDYKQVDKLLSEYKRVVDYSSLVSITDLRGVITYVNDPFCKVSGYSREELIGHTHNVVRHEDMGTEYFKNLWHTIQLGNVFHDTIKNRQKNGNSYYVDTVIAPIFDYYNEATGYISIRQDVTERLESIENAILAEEKAVEAKIEAVQAEKAKDDFLSNMSHEIRTPLNAILGFVHLLEKSNLNGKDKGYLSVISNSGNSLLSLINDILDFAKIRSGKFDLDPYEFEPMHEFENSIELFTSKMHEKKIDYLVYIDPAMPKTLKGDAIRIKQILLNFLANALKFTPEYGSIRVKILFDKLSELLTLYVEDNGIGIKQENKDKIFGAFSQEEMTTSRKFGGTGLGLSISQSLAALMDGKIGLFSKEGEGSTFFVHLPISMITENMPPVIDSVIALYHDEKLKEEFVLLQRYLNEMKISYQVIENMIAIPDVQHLILSAGHYDKHITHRPQEEALKDKKIILLDYIHGSHESLASNVTKLFLPLYPSKILKIFTTQGDITEEKIEGKKYQGHILVAEDNKTNQLLIKILLDDYGLTYSLAEDGVQAYKQFKEADYDLVLMDNNMPNMSGVQATKEILAFEETFSKNHTPIVALTANATNEDREHFLSSGMDAYLSKPLDIKELERIFETYLNVSGS